MPERKRRRLSNGNSVKPELPSSRSVVDTMAARINSGTSRAIETSNGGSKYPDEAEFKPGYILHVKVWNFTTYTYGEFTLSPTLNMIIGPNGTGKSTLVSAICLGLGGKIDLIKRKSLKSMIKSGFGESKIQITLKGREQGRNHLIERKFTEKESKWKINNHKSDEKSVKKLCQSFNIQLDNLCHFLPQERVAEFAGLSPEKLLLETQRTIGDGHTLLSMHEDLIRNDNEREQLKTKLERQEADHRELLETRNRLQEDAKKYEEYQAKTQDLKNHQKLIPYAQIQDLKLQQRHLKKERDLAKSALEKFNLDSKPIEEELDDFKKGFEEAKSSYNETENERQDTRKLLELHTEEKTTLLLKVDDLKRAIVQLKDRSNRKRKELEVFAKEKDTIQNKFDKEFPQTILDRLNDEEHLNDLKESRESRRNNVLNIKSQIDDLEHLLRPKQKEFENFKHQMNDRKERLTSNDKLDVLRRNLGSQGSRDPYIDLKENSLGAHKFLRSKSEFQGRYYECPVVSCEVDKSDYGKYFEKIIDNNTLWGLSFTSKEDYDEINHSVFKNFNVPMRIITNAARKSRVSDETVKRFGFEGYLSEFISGPPEVLNMLNEISNLNNIPVSSKPLSEEQLNRLLDGDKDQNPPFTRFFSGEVLFNVSKSRYGSKQLFFSSEKIFPGRIFNSNSNTVSEHTKQQLESEIQSLKQKLQSILAEVETHKQKLKELRVQNEAENQKYEGVVNQIDEILKLRNIKNTLEAKISAKDEAIKNLEKESQRDLSDKVSQVKSKIKQLFHQISKKELQATSLVTKIADLSVTICHKQFQVIEWENKVITATSILNGLDQYKEHLKQTYAQAKAKYDEIKKSDAAKKIQEQSTSYTNEERQVLGALAAQYLASKTLSEAFIRNKIKLIEEERSLMSTADQSSMEQLNRKLQEIEFAEREIPILQSKQQQLTERIETIRTQWEPQLTDLVNKISQTFRKRFTAVASDGQVEIGKADRFKDWKLQILVKFRENSELKILDHQSQSGGERAVSTIFFIMSLQGLTDAPIRVVDEINQGMDPNNEKVAHKYLVHTACNNNSSQYFLVTPKLLTGLYYHPSMMIHCIFTDTKKEGTESKPVGFLDFANNRRAIA